MIIKLSITGEKRRKSSNFSIVSKFLKSTVPLVFHFPPAESSQESGTPDPGYLGSYPHQSNQIDQAPDAPRTRARCFPRSLGSSMQHAERGNKKQKPDS